MSSRQRARPLVALFGALVGCGHVVLDEPVIPCRFDSECASGQTCKPLDQGKLRPSIPAPPPCDEVGPPCTDSAECALGWACFPASHAIEVRINAEDPRANFAPSPGRITRWQAPAGTGVRLDTHAQQGYLVPPFYDSMIGKLIVHGADRGEAIERLLTAIREFALEGPRCTLPLAAFIVDHPDFRNNRITTRWLEDKVLPAFAPG